MNIFMWKLQIRSHLFIHLHGVVLSFCGLNFRSNIYVEIANKFTFHLFICMVLSHLLWLKTLGSKKTRQTNLNDQILVPYLSHIMPAKSIHLPKFNLACKN